MELFALIMSTSQTQNWEQNLIVQVNDYYLTIKKPLRVDTSLI